MRVLSIIFSLLGFALVQNSVSCMPISGTLSLSIFTRTVFKYGATDCEFLIAILSQITYEPALCSRLFIPSDMLPERHCFRIFELRDYCLSFTVVGAQEYSTLLDGGQKAPFGAQILK